MTKFGDGCAGRAGFGAGRAGWACSIDVLSTPTGSAKQVLAGVPGALVGVLGGRAGRVGTTGRAGGRAGRVGTTGRAGGRACVLTGACWGCWLGVLIAACWRPGCWRAGRAGISRERLGKILLHDPHQKPMRFFRPAFELGEVSAERLYRDLAKHPPNFGNLQVETPPPPARLERPLSMLTSTPSRPGQHAHQHARSACPVSMPTGTPSTPAPRHAPSTPSGRAEHVHRARPARQHRTQHAQHAGTRAWTRGMTPKTRLARRA
jgi:hypothetical protein